MSRIPGRIYVQPQWVWDCINQFRLLRPDLYAPGATLPPHLSPWVKSKPGAYDPTKALVEQEKEGEAEFDEAEAALEKFESHDIVSADLDYIAVNQPARFVHNESDDEEILPGEGMQVDDSASDNNDQEQNEVEEWEGLSDQGKDDLSDGAEERDQYQRELEAETAGQTFSTKTSREPDKLNQLRKQRSLKQRLAQEELDRQKMMMPNKKRKLYDKMQFGNQKRNAEAEKLRKKRRKIERALATTPA